MSMRSTLLDQTYRTGDYVVGAPQVADMLADTLRAAYATESPTDAHFTDLIRQLDLIEAIPIRR